MSARIQVASPGPGMEDNTAGKQKGERRRRMDDDKDEEEKV